VINLDAEAKAKYIQDNVKTLIGMIDEVRVSLQKFEGATYVYGGSWGPSLHIKDFEGNPTETLKNAEKKLRDTANGVKGIIRFCFT